MKLNHNIHKLKKAEPGLFSKWIKIVISFLFLINIYSCNSPEDPGQENFINTPFVNHFETGTTSGTISFDFGENLKYQVVLAPKWLNIKAVQGKIENGKLNIPFEFSNIQDYMGQESFISGNLVVRIGYIGLFSFTVSYGNDDGTNPNPGPNQFALICSVSNLVFESSDTLSFTLTNPDIFGNAWQAVDISPWLKLSEYSGYISGGNQVTIKCSLNKQGLQIGDYTQYISIVSTNPSSASGVLVKMTVDVPVPFANQSNIKWIDGKVKDANFCKTTNYLYALTQNPNQLLYKLPDNDSLYTIPLGKVPNCIDVSQDGKTLAIGYNQAIVDLFDAQTFELKRSYETECVPFDIVLGENDWCYLTPDFGQWVQLHSLNLKTGVTVRAGNYSAIYERTIISKVPEKPLLYATRAGLFSSGVLAINIADGAANDTIPIWNIDTGPAIWLSPDSKKLISSSKYIYKAPDYTTDLFTKDLPIIASIDIPQSIIKTIDFCENFNSYFVVGTDYFWDAHNAETIYQIDAENYSTSKSVKVQPYPGIISDRNNPKMDVHHVFTNKQGTKLFAVKNLTYEVMTNKWALEIFDLPLK